MHRLTAKFRRFFMREVKPSLCHDCEVKLERKFGLAHRIKHKIHRRKGHKLHGAAKRAFLRRMAAGRRKAKRR